MAQASILQLYDPGRSATVIHDGQVGVWGALLANVDALLEKDPSGAGLRFLEAAGWLVNFPEIAALRERGFDPRQYGLPAK